MRRERRLGIFPENKMNKDYSKENVTVAVRIRPALRREVEEGAYNSCIGLQDRDVFVVKKDVPILVDDKGAIMSDDTLCLDRFRYDHSFGTKSDTLTVYDTVCRGVVDGVLQGTNQTIFAYGQTGSGKTFTMLSDENSIVKMCARDLFQSGEVDTVHVSYMQIYNGIISDLTTAANKESLRIRENIESGETYVEGLSILKITSEKELVEFMQRAGSNRKSVSTKLNSSSSRSHAVLSFYVESKDYVAKLNIVDLAGSERVKDSQVVGKNFTEAVHINTSLSSLARVVRALNDKNAQYVPYRDSPLCMLLKDALGGNCKTIVIATVSPSMKHCQETLSTLRFGAACSHVCNRIKHKPIRKTISSAWRSKASVESKTKPNYYAWKNFDIQNMGGRTYLQTSFGKISLLAYGNPSHPLVICLHGSPSSAEYRYGGFLLSCLVYHKFFAVAIDMPGCGKSTGKQLKCRCENALKQGQAGDFVNEIRKKLGAKKYSIVGYDWGAGIGLAMSSSKKFNGPIEQVVSFHPPAMTDHLGDKRNIKRINSKVMVIFSKRDNFHPWNKWKSTACMMKKVLGKDRYHQYIFKGAEDWDVLEIEHEIASFLTGKKLNKGPNRVFQRPAEKVNDTDGTSITEFSNIVFKQKAIKNEYEAGIFKYIDPGRKAINKVLKIFQKYKKEEQYLNLYKLLELNDRNTKALIARLPKIDEKSLEKGPAFLIENGFWDPGSLRGVEEMLCSVRYNIGRQVYFKGMDGETHCGIITNVLKSHVEVSDMDGKTSGVSMVSRHNLCKFNHPQKIPKTKNGKLILEDGLWCDYNCSYTKLKMWELAYKLQFIAKKLDYTSLSVKEIQDCQEQVVQIIFENVNIVTFQRDENDSLTSDGKHTRVRHRYCKDNIGKFAYNGQGHCHTVSSTMAAILLPWCSVFGIDLKYRETYSKSHQWLELSFRPSNQTVILDLYREDTERLGVYINQPITQADFVPSLKLNVFSERQVTITEILETDFEE